MSVRSVLGQSRIVVGCVAADMGGDPLALVKYLHRPLRGPDLDLLVKIPVRDAVVVFGEGDVVVDVHPGSRPLGPRRCTAALRIQRSEVRILSGTPRF